MTRTGTVIVASVIALASQGLSMPPKVVVDDLSHLEIQRVFPTVQSMPQSLQRALARTFHQPTLSMANPTENLRNEMTPGIEPEHYYPHRAKNGEVITVGPVNPSSPDRRLLFGFETGRFLYVYYQQAHPSSAACLVFAKKVRLGRALVWGGADVRMPRYESTPRGLANRILSNRLDDSEDFFW